MSKARTTTRNKTTHTQNFFFFLLVSQTHVDMWKFQATALPIISNTPIDFEFAYRAIWPIQYLFDIICYVCVCKWNSNNLLKNCGLWQTLIPLTHNYLLLTRSLQRPYGMKQQQQNKKEEILIIIKPQLQKTHSTEIGPDVVLFYSLFYQHWLSNHPQILVSHYRMPMEFDINIGILCAQKFRDMESGRIYTKHHMHGFQGDDHTTVIKVAVQFFYN